MAFCCDDPTALFRDDFESGAPLTVEWELISDCGLNATAGINGSSGVLATDALAQLSTKPLAIPTKCDDILAWGFGGYWKFSLDPGIGGFYFAELRQNTTTILSFYKDGTDLIVYIGVSSNILARVNGLFPSNSIFYKIDISGRVASAAGGSDGNLTIATDNIERVCLRNSSDIDSFGFLSPGWNVFAVGPQGSFDCAYATMGWICGRGPILQPTTIPGTNQLQGNPCCGNGGPGGGTSQWTYHSLTPSLKHPQSSTPVLIPPGGAPPSYTACTGDGIGPTGTDPIDPQTLAGIATPLVYLDLGLPDATNLRLSQGPVATPGKPRRDPRIAEIGPISQVLSDHFGRLSAQEIHVTLRDADHLMHGHAVDATNRYLKGSPGTFWAESDAARRAGTSPLKLASTLLRRFRPGRGADRTFQLEFVDELFARQSPTSVDRPLPPVLVGDVFPNAAENVTHIPIPIYFGEYGDDDKSIENPARVPVGIAPLIGPIGPPELLSDGNTWDPYVVCLYAIGAISSIFGSNLHPGGPGSVRWDPDDEGSIYLIPGGSGYNAIFATPYQDVTAPDGTVYRVTKAYARGEQSRDHKEGRVPMSVNLCGIEEIGDGTGKVITDAAEVLYFLLNFIVFQTVTTGTWGAPSSPPAVPVDATGTPKVSRQSAIDLKAIHDARIAGRYEVAWALREHKTVSAYLTEFLRGTGIRLGRDRHQVIMHTLDDQADLSSLTTFDHASIVPGTFTLDPAADEIVNKISFVYGPEAATGRFSGPIQSIKDTGEIALYDATFDRVDVEMHPIRKGSVAADVMSHELLRKRNEIRYGSFQTDLRGVTLTVGQLIQVTNDEGLGTTGWTSRVVLVVGITMHPDMAEMLATIHVEDIHDIVVRGGTTSTSAVGFQPMGTDGVDAFVMGTSGVDAYRMGSTGL